MSGEKSFDVFLSHNSEDKPVVELLGRMLGGRGYASYLDKDLIEAGDDLTDELIDGLSRSRCTLVFLGRTGLGPWQKAEVFLARFLKKNAGMAVVAVLLDGARDTDVSAESGRRYLDLRGVFSIDGVRDEGRFEAFMAELCGQIDRLRAEAGVAGRFTPDDGKVLVNTSRGGTRAEPDILPLLCDRSEQVHDVRKIAPQATNRPCLIILESDDRQSPESFCERLREFTLPKLLNLEAGPQSIDLIDVQLARRYRSAERFRECLGGDLAERIDVDQPERLEIAKEMSKRGDVSLVQIFFRSPEWNDEGEGRLRAILDFWNEFPELQAGKRLLIVLYVQYLESDSGARGAMRKSLDQLVPEGGEARHENLPLFRLYAIEGAERGNFEDWARLEEVRRAYRIPRLARRVRELFDELCPPGRSVVPLEDAEDALYDLLNEMEPS